MDVFAQVACKIIEEQEGIIGPIALEQAQKVQGLRVVDWKKHEIVISGNATEALEKLVEKFKDLFGQASVEVCRDAIKHYKSKIPQDKLPAVLQ